MRGGGNAAARPVILDTNAWLLPFSDGTDLEDELRRLLGAHRCILPDSVALELQRLAEGESQVARNARPALRLAQQAASQREATSLPGDDGILEVARRLGAAVVTNDRRLAQEARRSGLLVLRSRGHGRLMRDDQ